MNAFESQHLEMRPRSCRIVHSLFRRIGLAVVSVAAAVVCADAARAADPPAEWKGLRTVWYSNWGAFLALHDAELPKDMPAGDITMLVAGVAEGSAAQEANLARGDWVFRVSGGFAKVGEVDSITIERGGESYTVDITTREHKLDEAVLPSSGKPQGTSRTRVVARDGSGDYHTIIRALSTARPGDTVSVRDGLYREQLIIPHGVTLEAAEDAAVYVEAPQPIRFFGTEDAVIRRLNVRGLEKTSDIWARGAKNVRFEDLTLSRDTPGSLVSLDHCTSVDLSKCSLLGMADADGVAAWNSEVKVVDCSIAQCFSGIKAVDHSRITAEGNVLEENFHGIRAFDSRLTAANNGVTGVDAKKGGGLVAVNSEVALQDNVVRRQDSGFFASGARGTVKNSTFAQCRVGMLLNSPGLAITGNRISNNAGTGVFLADDKSADKSSGVTVVADNTIAFNGASGIAVFNHAADITGNVLEANNAGVWLTAGPADISHNTIVVQQYVGIVAEASARGTVANNIVALGKVGLRVDARSPCRFESNVVYAHFGSRGFPPVELNYVRVERLPIAGGDLLPVSIFPALDIVGKGDLQVDPKFVRVGSDYRLAADSPLAAVKGTDGKLIGALPLAER